MYITKIKIIMPKVKYMQSKRAKNILRSSSLIITVFAFLVATILPNYVIADQYTDQINALQAQNDQKQAQAGILSVEASSLSDAISKLQAQIDAAQARINQLSADIDSLKKQIKEAEIELAKQKALLSQSIKAMYVSGDISTVEMLMSSKDLSDFFDKQQYQESVREKIKTTLDKVTQLKLDLATKKEMVEKSLAEQKTLQNQLAGQKAEKNRVLTLNQDQQNQLQSEISQNNDKVKELRRQQAIENAKHFRGVQVVAGSNGRDTYPNAWRNSGKDTMLDNWGMYNRECVSYTAWKVYESNRFMPYWGGVGNANQWDDNARAAGIAVDTNPRAGDVAIAHWGYYGHAMYVESVNGDGTINISQYNWDYNGTYSEAYNFPASGLVFIHF